MSDTAAMIGIIKRRTSVTLPSILRSDDIPPTPDPPPLHHIILILHVSIVNPGLVKSLEPPPPAAYT